MKVRTENDKVIEWKNKDGLLHREDGPAVEWADGFKFWYLNGEIKTEQEFNNLILKKRLQRIINF